MKKLNRWTAPLIVAVLTTVISWEVGSLFGNGKHIWENNSHFIDNGAETSTHLSSRLAVLIMAIPYYYIYHFFAEKMVKYFARKSKEKISVKEVLLVIFNAFFAVTVGTMLSSFLTDNDVPIWTTTIRNYGLLVPILFIYYIVMRNSQISEELHRQTQQIEKIKNNQLETELKYLRAQYHPHFLFNALNTIYFRIDEQNIEAKNTVELLSELLRYQLYNMEKEVNISEEINFINRYIQFQQLRMSKRLIMNVSIDNTLNEQKIYPLIYQPFLENAFKYVGGEYWINLEMKWLNKQIIFHLENSLPEKMPPAKKSGAGIGIENIKRRLALLYSDKYCLNIEQKEKSFLVELNINTYSNEN